MSAAPFVLTLTLGEEEILRVESDGYASFTVAGSRLRDPAYAGTAGHGGPSYSTDDDSHVLGLVSQHLAALCGLEVIRRSLRARAAEASAAEASSW